MTLTDPDDPIEDRLVALAREILDITDPESQGGALAVDRTGDDSATLTFVVGRRTEGSRTVTTREIDFDPRTRRFRVHWSTSALEAGADDLKRSLDSIDATVASGVRYHCYYKPPDQRTLEAAFDALRFVLSNGDVDKLPEGVEAIPLDPNPSPGSPKRGTLLVPPEVVHVDRKGRRIRPKGLDVHRIARHLGARS